MNKKLFVISGCSGVGKGTVLKEFMTRNSEHFLVSISCTTRKPRPGEVDGVNYFFVTKDEFTRCINENKFLEYAEFAGNFYGTKKKYITQKLEEGMNVILEIETQGALKVKQQMPEAVLIFIAPPSFEELEHRLRGRHTEDEAAIQKRLHEVSIEIERSKQYDYVVVNDSIQNAVEELEKITTRELE